jgi:alpha-galactosidase
MTHELIRGIYRATARAIASAGLLATVSAIFAGCGEKEAPKLVETPAPVSQVKVGVMPQSISLQSHSANFTIAANGAVRAALTDREGAKSSLDSGSHVPGLTVKTRGGEIVDFAFDLANAMQSVPIGKIGALGKRVEIDAKSAKSGLEATLAVEVYDDFPNIALVSASVRNRTAKDVALTEVNVDAHRFSAAQGGVNAGMKTAPNDMWSFHGASIRWGKENVFPIPRHFSQENQMGSMVKVSGDLGGVGGGIPVVAFWTRDVGEAIGHVEPLPLVLSIPVHTEANGEVDASVKIEPGVTLHPNDTYATPRTFVSVYHGDYFEPLRIYSDIVDREGLPRAKSTNEDYAVSWCGWGYLSDVTPKQMLGTVPKLKELGIHWATLDDRWFNNYGDWQPRSDTFPGDTIRQMVQSFHEQGIKVQLWWLPLAVEDGGPGYESHPYGVSDVVKQHPDWLVLDKNGKPARMTRNLATLCPAVPEVREYYKQLTQRIIRDWNFDGHKLDNIYSVPQCFNPKHHHKSPNDSVYAMGEIYKTIFETTRALKPESVTQSCPCGTPPSIAWLRYIDQAVTADPVGSVQVRQRVKMYKALMGDDAAVYGDHVELTRVMNPNGDERDLGSDFASTLGTGGVLGTKFTWPDYGPKVRDAYLTPEKNEHWKKWIALYNEKMLSRGKFRNLYVYGYDFPEGYAIEKDGAMYYAFFAPDPAPPDPKGRQANSVKPRAWSGEIELRGLDAGTYHVVDYVDGRDYGTVTAPNAKLQVTIADHLLLEARKR